MKNNNKIDYKAKILNKLEDSASGLTIFEIADKNNSSLKKNCL